MTQRAYFESEPKSFNGDLPEYIDVRKETNYNDIYNNSVNSC